MSATSQNVALSASQAQPMPTALTAGEFMSYIQNPKIVVRESREYPHIVSVVLKRAVFYDNLWKTMPLMTRGFFINRDTRQVVARGYEKFFNFNETEENTLDALGKRLRFPVSVHIKENGFIGLVGYDAKTDSLVFASKSVLSPEGDFALLAETSLRNALDKNKKEESLAHLKALLKESNLCLTMEVISPEHDPHIIEYDKSGVVLLDILHRSPQFVPLDYNETASLGQRLNLPVKKLACTLETPSDLADFAKANEKSLAKIEGYVLRDADNQQLKIKSPFYIGWKIARSHVARLALERVNKNKSLRPLQQEKLAQYGAGIMAEEIMDFADWAQRQDTPMLSSDIISLRRAYWEELGHKNDVSAVPEP